MRTRIQQLCCNAGEHFRKGLTEKYNLTRYSDPDKPVIFFGAYGMKQVKNACNNKAAVVMVWAGTDALVAAHDAGIVEMLKKAKHVKHIAIASFIEEDLKKAGIPYTALPVLPYLNANLKAEMPGEAVYIYKPDFMTYGRPLNEAVKKALPRMKFIEADFGTYNHADMPEVYRQCFMGLRFTNHDGLSNTVCEMGLMGRRVVWNGNTPNAIPYNRSVDEIVRVIIDEYNNRMTGQYESVAEKVRNYLDITDEFLYV